MAFRANPKSAMTTEEMSFGLASNRFSSLRSLCVTLLRCMYARASRSCRAMDLASSSCEQTENDESDLWLAFWLFLELDLGLGMGMGFLRGVAYGVYA